MQRILFDIGANTGQYTDANADKYDQVILVDANPALCEVLRKKYQSQKSKYIVENVLVSNETSATFYVSSTADTISTAAVRWVTDSRFTGSQKWVPSAQPIPCMSLDALIAKYGIPAYIKIDVEGYEYNVLRSLTVGGAPLAFEWAEELLDEVVLSVQYLAEVPLRYTRFAVQMEDAYRHEPDPKAYMNAVELITYLQKTLRPARKSLWGMIHCRG